MTEMVIAPDCADARLSLGAAAGGDCRAVLSGAAEGAAGSSGVGCAVVLPGSSAGLDGDRRIRTLTVTAAITATPSITHGFQRELLLAFWALRMTSVRETVRVSGAAPYRERSRTAEGGKLSSLRTAFTYSASSRPAVAPGT